MGFRVQTSDGRKTRRIVKFPIGADTFLSLAVVYITLKLHSITYQKLTNSLEYDPQLSGKRHEPRHRAKFPTKRYIRNVAGPFGHSSIRCIFWGPNNTGLKSAERMTRASPYQTV